jgi:hypothetical protein
MLGHKPSPFDPKAFEFVFSINRSFMNGSIKLKAAYVVNTIIAAYLFVKTNESSVENGMVFGHWFDIADLDVLAL